MRMYNEYLNCIERRKTVLIRFLNLQAPNVMVKLQCKLINQSFIAWLWYKIFDRVYARFYMGKTYKDDVIDSIPYNFNMTEKKH